MESYFISKQTHKTYKLTQDSSGRVLLFWVMVHQEQDGSFVHSRGADVLPSYDKGLEVCRLMAEPSDEEQYIRALKDYFAIDKKIRQAFIQKYNL